MGVGREGKEREGMAGKERREGRDGKGRGGKEERIGRNGEPKARKGREWNADIISREVGECMKSHMKRLSNEICKGVWRLAWVITGC